MKRFLFTLAALLSLTPLGAVKIIHGPYLQNLGPDEVTVVWVTDVATLGWVEIAPDDGKSFYNVPRTRYFDAPYGVKEETRVHKVRVSKLQPGTTYRYRAYAQEVAEHKGNFVSYGKTVATDPYQTLTFKTSDPKVTSIEFAVVNDIHGDNDKLKDLIGQCNLDKTDFFIFNGDMVSVSESEEQIFKGFMDTACVMFASKVPMYYARGNHETRGAMATKYKNYFSPAADHLYYTFRQGPALFVILDCGEDKPDTDIEYYGITDYDNYRTVQAEWLADVVNSQEYKEAPFKIVVCHMPPENGWHGSVDLLEKMVPILNENTPDAMICGHLHKHYIREANSDIKFPVLINDNQSIIKAKVNPSSFSVKFLDRSGKQTDSFEIKK